MTGACYRTHSQFLLMPLVRYDPQVTTSDESREPSPGVLLLRELAEAGGRGYNDHRLDLNRLRIPAVHAKREVPIPSREQAAMW